MKICLINNLYKPYQRGGAESVVELIVQGLQNKGHDVFIITTRPLFKEVKNQKSKIRCYYIPALYYNLNLLPKILRLFWHIIDMFDLGSYLKIKSILKKEKPDVVMTHNLKGITYLIPWIIKKLSIKHIHTLHDIQLLHPSGLMLYRNERILNSVFAKIYYKICSWLFNSPGVIISPSKWLLEIHKAKSFFKNSKLLVIPNPAHIAEKKHAIELINNEKFKFLSVGQIEEHKGILFLIKAFKMLYKDLKRDNCELIIVGDGSKIKDAKNLAKSDKDIKFLGRISNNEVLQIMQSVNCLVIPSLCYENSPTVIYEALNIGLPVIASRIGGIPELIHSTAGILFKPGNGGDLMYQMKWVMENKDELQKIGARGRVKVKEFSLNNYINSIEELIK